MANKTVKCRSGITGWQGKLRSQYSSKASFISYSETYSLHTRLGYKTPESAWKHNPTVQGSTIPSDYCKISGGKRRFAKI